ncbi:MAG TPA: ABC transporter permease [Firmicutes bacterium]|nr:ABC transporter permease [Candidatus Fermentithermobacillaceae bacterium]
MDFLRLAIIETKRNSSRTIVATLAAAFAAFVVVLLRFMPEGYATGYALPERSFTGGDILVFPGHVSLSSSKAAEYVWRGWPGRDWQSHILYFFPELPEKGYLSPQVSKGWRGMFPEEVIDRLQDIPEIAQISVYRSLPCLVRTGQREVPAILRGLKISPGKGYSIAPYVTTGRTLEQNDEGKFRALVPVQVEPFEEIKPDSQLEIRVPGVSLAYTQGPPGSGSEALPQTVISWDTGKTYEFTAVGGYQIQVGEVSNPEAAATSPGGVAVIPVYWERPEVIVPDETFEIILRDVSGKDPGASFPTYQIAITVTRMSKLKETARLIQERLGPDYGVFSIPDLLSARASGRNQIMIPPDVQRLVIWLVLALSGIVVTGNIYVLLAQQRRKIGLLRVVGATSRNIVTYALSLVVYVTITGTMSGFLAGKFLYLLVLLGSDMTWKEWMHQCIFDLATTLGISVAISGFMGLLIGFWASKTPCSEVLNRE